MSAAHTPGPWAYINPDGVRVRHPQIYSDNGPICNATWLGDGNLKELQANARLIAAAPDLLEALQELIYIAGVLAPTCMGDEGPKENCLDRAIAAVEKATGKRWKT